MFRSHVIGTWSSPRRSWPSTDVGGTAGGGMPASTRHGDGADVPLLVANDLMGCDRRLGPEEVVARPALLRVIAGRERFAHCGTAQVLQRVVDVPEEFAGADPAPDAPRPERRILEDGRAMRELHVVLDRFVSQS